MKNYHLRSSGKLLVFQSLFLQHHAKGRLIQNETNMINEPIKSQGGGGMKHDAKYHILR